MAQNSTNSSAYEFIVSELKNNRTASYAEIQEKAQKKGLQIYPVVFGNAQRVLGIVKKKAKQAAAMPAKRGRPKGAVAGGSKSAEIRELLASGLGATAIAKKVGCSVNLVYVVKRKAEGGEGGRSRASAPKSAKVTEAAPARGNATGSSSDLEKLLEGVRAIEAERDALREALTSMRDALARLV